MNIGEEEQETYEFVPVHVEPNPGPLEEPIEVPAPAEPDRELQPA